MAGFADGFSMGAGIVQRGIALRDAQKRAEQQDQLAQIELDQKKKQIADAEALRASQQDVGVTESSTTVSAPGGGNWSDGETQQAPAFSVGQRLYDSQQAAQAEVARQNSMAGKQKRAADVLRSQGRIDVAAKLDEQLAGWKQEGLDKAMDTILAGGDGAAAKEAFNSSGKMTLGDKDDVRVLRRYQITSPGMAPIDTAEVEVTLNGQRTVIPNLVAARHKIDPYKVAQVGYGAQRDEVKDAASAKAAALAERKADQADAAQRERERMNEIRAQQIMASIGLTNARISGLEGGGKGKDGDKGITTEQLDKWDGDLEGRAKNLFPEAELGATPEQVAGQRQSRNQWKLMSLNTLTYARANGEPMSVEFASQAAQEAMRNPESRKLKELSDGRVVPVVSFQGKTVQVGAPMAKPAAPAAETKPADKPAAKPSMGARVAEAAAKPDFAPVTLTPAEQAMQAQYDQQRAARDAAQASTQADQAALKAITPAQINKMSAAEAQAALDKFGNRLSGRQTAALRSRL